MACDGFAISRTVDIGEEYWWTRRERPLPTTDVVARTVLLRSFLDDHPGTIHVHFLVSEPVEPSPGKERLARWRIWRDDEVVIGCNRATAFD